MKQLNVLHFAVLTLALAVSGSLGASALWIGPLLGAAIIAYQFLTSARPEPATVEAGNHRPDHRSLAA